MQHTGAPANESGSVLIILKKLTGSAVCSFLFSFISMSSSKFVSTCFKPALVWANTMSVQLNTSTVVFPVVPEKKKKSIGKINVFMGKIDEFQLLVVWKSPFPAGLCLWIMPCCCVSKCTGLGNGFCRCRAVGRWSMEEHLWYLFCCWCHCWLQLKRGSGGLSLPRGVHAGSQNWSQISRAAWIFQRGSGGFFWMVCSTPLSCFLTLV